MYSLGGGGNSLFMGGWVPQARAQGIMDAGVDPEIYEMQQLNDYALAHPEARGDTMRKYYDAMDRWGMKGNQYEAEARQLTEQAMRNNATKLYNENPGPGSGGFGLAQQIAGSTLSGQSQAILGARLGRIMLPAGNALETLNGMGLPYSDGLKRYAASSDWLNQFSYNPENVYDPKSFGFGYKSMGIGGNNTSPIGYGGDGHQAAVGDWLAERGGQIAQTQANKYQNAMMNNKNPMGHFIGGPVQQGPGLEGIGQHGWIPDWMGDGKYTPGQIKDAISKYGKTQQYNASKGVTQMLPGASGKGSQGEIAVPPDLIAQKQMQKPGYWTDPYDPSQYTIGSGTAAGMAQSKRANTYGGDMKDWTSGGYGKIQDFAKKVGGAMLQPLKDGLGTWKGDDWFKQIRPSAIQNYRQNFDSYGNSKPFDSYSFAGSGLDDSGWEFNNTYGASQPMAGIAQAPKIQKHSQAFGGSLSPEWTGYDLGYGELFGRGYGQARSGNGSNSFDQWATGPMTAGQIEALMYSGW